jgi:hypothetical protein
MQCRHVPARLNCQHDRIRTLFNWWCIYDDCQFIVADHISQRVPSLVGWGPGGGLVTVHCEVDRGWERAFNWGPTCGVVQFALRKLGNPAFEWLGSLNQEISTPACHLSGCAV